MHAIKPSILISLLVLTGCATAHKERTPIAPTDTTVTTRLEAAYDGRGQHVIVSNTSTEAITVTSIQLRDCENIKNRCEVTRMRTPVPAGQSLRIVTVQTRDENRGSNFRYSWTWERSQEPTSGN